MRKIIPILLLLLCCSCSSHQRLKAGQEITVARVPDSNFRTYLLAGGLVKPYEGPLSGSNRLTARQEWVETTPLGRSTQLIDCHRKDIASLQGIELFPNLVILICSENPH